MNHPAFIALMQNAALLLALVVVFDLVAGRQRTDGRPLRQVAVGLILGGLCMALIHTSFRLESGIVFDTRSVLLSVSGLFFGAVPTLVAMAIAAAFRLFKGGAGAWTGVSVTLATGALGILWRRFRKGRLQDVSARELYAFGIAAHVIMLALMLTLPWDRAKHVLAIIGLPVLLIYPVAATVLGLLLANRLRREQAGNDLVASEARLSTALDMAQAGYWEYDMAADVFTFNDHFYRVYKTTAAEVGGYRISSAEYSRRFCHPDDVPLVAREIGAAIASPDPAYSRVFEHRILCGDGSVGHVAVKFFIVKDAQGRTVKTYGVNQNVTARAQAEAALRESEARLRLFIEHSPAALAMFDRDMRYLAVSRRWLADYGLEGQDLLGRSHYEIFPEIDEKIKQNHRRGLAGEVLRRDEDRLVRANGAVQYLRWEMHPWRDGNGGIGGIVIFTEDVTRQKLAETALRESEERFRTLVDGAPEGIFVQAEGRFLFVNPAMTRMLGAAKPEELVGTDLMARMAPEYREAIRQRILLQRETGGAAPPMEQEYLRFDGGRVPVETTAVPVRYANRDAHLVFVRDVSERKHVEEERQKLQSQLAQAQKMDSVGRLAGGVAHDFNNMLAVILGHAEMALENVAPGQPLYNGLQEIHKAAARSADLTRQLLAFARKQTVAPKVLDLDETVEGMLTMLRRLIGENIELAWHPGKISAQLLMDPSQIDQILANLCVNARDAIGDGGKVAIETGLAEFDDAHCAAHPGDLPGEFAWLAVSDDGCGMSRETLLHLFEPFFTTKEIGKGTGLGLATVYGIVKQNNGFINVYSEPGHGSTFRVYLPRHVALDAVQAPAPAPLPLAGHETILLVEDESLLLHMTRTLLEQAGYNVLVAHEPSAALQLAERHAGKIDLLITDVVMPGMNGRELARQLLARQPDLRRLFMSGYSADIIANHGVLDSGVHFISKPFSQAELAAKIRETLGEPNGKPPA